MNVGDLRVRHYHGERPAVEQEVAGLQELLGYPLPDDFVRFLLIHNGGSPEQDIFEINSEQGDTELQTLYGINPTDRRGDLHAQFQSQDAGLISAIIGRSRRAGISR